MPQREGVIVAAATTLPQVSQASLHLYQLYDISNSIDLDCARATLATPTARVHPVASRGGGSVDIRQLPLEISMGDYTLRIGDRDLRVYLHARIYDLGILAFRMIIPLAEPESWESITELMACVQNYPSSVVDTFEHHLESLHQWLKPAVERPNETIRSE